MSRLRIKHLSFLVPGTYPERDPVGGIEANLRLFAAGERLGYDGAWVRQRHLENSVSSAAAFLAAASQRTMAIQLGVAVIQMAYENPFRLAEDLATVDILSRGRLQVGLSGGRRDLAPYLGDLSPEEPAESDSYGRVAKLMEALSGKPLGPEDAAIVSAGGRVRPQFRPFAPGLTERLWYGGGSNRSVAWAAANGFNLLIGNINVAETAEGFTAVQLAHLDLFRAASGRPVEVGRVIVPLNGADRQTRARYRAFAAERHPRTLAPQGERRTQFAQDLRRRRR